MAKELNGLKVAVLVADGFEQIEMTEPRKALEQAGAQTQLISPNKKKVQGWHHDKLGDQFPVEVSLSEANADDYDALLLPGGVSNPDHLRIVPLAIELIKKMGNAGKPIAAICHGPWTLINANLVLGRTLTSWSSLQVDLINAGAKWVDRDVVKDGNLVTSRKPDDIPFFNVAMIDLFKQARQ